MNIEQNNLHDYGYAGNDKGIHYLGDNPHVFMKKGGLDGYAKIVHQIFSDPEEMIYNMVNKANADCAWMLYYHPDRDLAPFLGPS